MAGKFEKRWEKDFSEIQVLKAEWLITRRCNLNCSYCRIIDESTLQGRPECSTEQLVDMVKMFGEQWPGAPMIVYGGEPTVRDDLPEIIAAGRRYGVKLPVISNSLRILKDPKYLHRLLDAGLENWSVSFDGSDMASNTDTYTNLKSNAGLNALKMLRDQYGIRDLVTCTTVTRDNIDILPDMLQFLTEEGIHAIFTPLHIGGPRYQYGQGNPKLLPTQRQITDTAEVMYEMVSSGRYLCSNDAGWFKVWPEHFRKQDWMCNDKGLLTIDADGSLRYCVDIPFRDEDHMYVWELKTPEGRARYQSIVQKPRPCSGCLWNPAYECIKRARDPEVGIEEGRQRSRHYVAPERVDSLHNGAGEWFRGNPELKRVK